MNKNKIVSREEWVDARREHLAKEKEFTRLRDQLSAERRALPWVEVDKNYEFEGPDGPVSLTDAFAGRSQLIVYHFMFHPDWDEGCKSCSFWADNYNNVVVHLNQRDASFVVISRAPLAKLQAYRERMGWSFTWLSSEKNDFNWDYNVSFTPEQMQGEVYYNYTMGKFPAPEAPGISVFYKDEDGKVYNTYSCFSRGLDMLNGAYHHLDLLPKGRDEADLPYSMGWLRRHDEYEA